MALADILAALRDDGDAEVARIAADRDEAVAAIMRAAREEAGQAESAAAAARDAALAADADVIRHRAALHVERRLQEAREAVFQDVLGRARDRLSRLRQEPHYAATLDALLGECLDFLGGARVVMVDERDADLVHAALARRGIEAGVDPSLPCWGGLVAGDGRGGFVRNTLEDRLGRAEAELRRTIARLVPGLGGGAAGERAA